MKKWGYPNVILSNFSPVCLWETCSYLLLNKLFQYVAHVVRYVLVAMLNAQLDEYTEENDMKLFIKWAL